MIFSHRTLALHTGIVSTYKAWSSYHGTPRVPSYFEDLIGDVVARQELAVRLHELPGAEANQSRQCLALEPIFKGAGSSIPPPPTTVMLTV
jgi:hypothetical protein